jgi:hypothetical protein
VTTADRARTTLRPDADRAVRNVAHSTASEHRTWVSRAAFSLNLLIYGFGSWTLGYLAALALGLGWYFAVAFAIVAAAGVVFFALRWPLPTVNTSDEEADAVPLSVVFVAVLVAPVAFDAGRGVLVAAAGALLVLRALVPALMRRIDESDVRLVAIGGIAVLATLAFSWSWTVFVLLVCVIAIATITLPRSVQWFAGPGVGLDADPEVPDAPTSGGQAQSTLRPRPPTLASNLILAAFGVLLGVWIIGAQFWNPDNTYYLNKAEHYAKSTTSFPIRDYMFGFDDATHYPYGDIFSSYEPLIGALSATTGALPATLVFRIVTPAMMFLLPFAARYAARGLGLRRTNLVGGFAAAALILMTANEGPSLFASASLGKTIGRLVFIPLLIGAAGNLLRRRDPGSSLTATLAGACTVGSSPSLAFAAAFIVVPFTVAGVWDLRPFRAHPIRSRLSELASLAAPLALIGIYSLVAYVLQERAGSSQYLFGGRYPDPRAAWDRAVGDHRGHVLTIFFVAGAIAVFPLLLRSEGVRRAAALSTVLVFGIVLAPWLYETLVVDVLDLEYFAFRFTWAIPVSVLIGIALANADRRRRLGLLTVAAATLGLGLSGPDGVLVFYSIDADVRDAPSVWPWDAGIPQGLQDAADAVGAATPEGGRFLAPPSVEGVATATQLGRFPVYARDHYVVIVGAESAPRDFFVDDRLLLARGMAGKQQSAQRFAAALDRVEVDTVCVDENTAPNLRQAVRTSFVERRSARLCDVWVRRQGSDVQRNHVRLGRARKGEAASRASFANLMASRTAEAPGALLKYT